MSDVFSPPPATVSEELDDSLADSPPSAEALAAQKQEKRQLRLQQNLRFSDSFSRSVPADVDSTVEGGSSAGAWDARLRDHMQAKQLVPPRPVMVTGVAGSGKTWISEKLAAWGREKLRETVLRGAEDAGVPVCVIHHAVGATHVSLRHTTLLSLILSRLKETFDIEKELPHGDQVENVTHTLAEWAALAAERGPTLLIVDGVTDLQDYRDALRLSWLPDPAAKGKYPFQVVVTAAPESLAVDSAQSMGWAMWMITPPSRVEAGEIVDGILTKWGELPAKQPEWSAVRQAIVDSVVPARPPPNPRTATERPQRGLDAGGRVWVGRLSPRYMYVMLGELREEEGDARLTACNEMVTPVSSLSAQKPRKPEALPVQPYALFAAETKPAVMESLGVREGLGPSDTQVLAELKLRWDNLGDGDRQGFEKTAADNTATNKAAQKPYETDLALWHAKFVGVAEIGGAAPGGHVVGLYAQKIRRLAEDSGFPKIMKRVLGWLGVARIDTGEAGLARGELEGLLETTFGLDGVDNGNAKCIAAVMKSADPLLRCLSTTDRTGAQTEVKLASKCSLRDRQLREAVAKVCMGEEGVKEAELHYQLATYFLDVVGAQPSLPGNASPELAETQAEEVYSYSSSESRYVDLAWHLRQANVKAELRNIITEPMALHQFMQQGSDAQYLQFCRFCYERADASNGLGAAQYQSVIRQLIAEIKSEREFPVEVVESCARFCYLSACYPQALELFKKCLGRVSETMEAETVDILEAGWPGFPNHTSPPVTEEARAAANLKRVEYMYEIASLHARNGEDVRKGGTEQERHDEAEKLLLGALDRLGVGTRTESPRRPTPNIYKPPPTPPKKKKRERAPIVAHHSGSMSSRGALSVGQSYESLKLIGKVQQLLGLLRMFQRKYDDALRYAEEANKRRKANSEMVASAETLNLCGSIYTKQANAEMDSPSEQEKLLTRAQECFKESLELRRSLLSQNHPDIAQSLNSIGELYQQMKNNDKAVSYYQQAYDAYTAYFGEMHFRASYPLGPLASIAYSDGRKKEAVKWLSLKVDILSRVPGKKDELSDLQDILQQWNAELGEATPGPRISSMPEEELDELSESEGGGMAMVAAKMRFWDDLSRLLEERGSMDKIAQTERDQLIDAMMKNVVVQAPKAEVKPKNDSIIVVNENIEYHVHEVLGRGSFSKVFRGAYTAIAGGRRSAPWPAAIKRVDRAFFTSIERERQALEANSHPNVVKIYGSMDSIAADQEYAYLALELCSTSLEMAVKEDKLPVDDLLELCNQMVKGLEHLHGMGTSSGSSNSMDAHNQGFVHMDLHPGNVLLADGAPTANGFSRPRPVLSDFGLSRTLGEDHGINTTMTHAGAGGWAAPEARVAGGAPAASMTLPKAADVFSLGCVLYFTLTQGDHPFGDRHQREANISRHTAEEDGEEFGVSEAVDTRDLSSPMLTDCHRHLIEWMTRSDPFCRPDIGQVSRHPAFWSVDEQHSYLRGMHLRVNNTVQVRNGRSSQFAEVLMERATEELGPGGWMSLLRVDTTELKRTTSGGYEKTPSGGFDVEKLALDALSTNFSAPLRPSSAGPTRPSSAGPSLARTSSADTLGRQGSSDDGVFGLLGWIAAHRLPEDESDAALQDWWAGLVVRPFPWLLITVATLDAEYSSAKTMVDISDAAPMVDPYLPPIVKELKSRVRTKSHKNNGGETSDLAKIASLDGESQVSSDTSMGSSGPSDMVNQELERCMIPVEDLEFVTWLDEGANGAVYRAVWRGREEVAVKTAKGEPDRIENVINDLKHEIVQCQRLNHVNIVQFLGACRGSPPASMWAGEQLMLVNELMAISLFEQLFTLREKDKTVTWTAAVKWAHNIACGMDHLHDKKLNHLDLKSGNVLLTGTVVTSKGKMMAGVQSTAKIADFGNLRRAVVQPTKTQKTMTLTRTTFYGEEEPPRKEDNGVPTRPTEQQALKLALKIAKAVNDPDPEEKDATAEQLGLAALPEAAAFARISQAYQAGEFGEGLSQGGEDSDTDGWNLGTPEWQAPELLDGPKHITPKADVYSFGMVMYEFLTMDRPYMGFPGWRDIVAGNFGPDLVAIWAMQGHRPSIPASCPQVWSALMRECWSHKPSDRPTFREVAQRLKAIKESGEARTWKAESMGRQPEAPVATKGPPAVPAAVKQLAKGNGGGGNGGEMKVVQGVVRVVGAQVAVEVVPVVSATKRQ